MIAYTADHGEELCEHGGYSHGLVVKPWQEVIHVPLIVNESGKKLSKRRDKVSVQAFREEGYLADAVRNWLVRLGWSHGDDEIFSQDDIARLFDLEHVGRASARADTAKLTWLNQHYLKSLPIEALFEAVQPSLEAIAEGPVPRSAALDRLLDLCRERSKVLTDFAPQARWWLRDDIELDAKAAKKHLRPVVREPLSKLRGELEGLDPWTEAGLEAAFERVLAACGDLPLGKLAQPVRVAVTGGTTSPGIFETLEVLGPDRTRARLAGALEWIAARADSA